MRHPQHSDLPTLSTYELAMRVISALIGVVVLVGLAATVDARPRGAAAAPVRSTALDRPLPREQLLAEGAGLPELPPAVMPSARPAHKAAPRVKTPHPAKPAVRRATATRRWLPSGTGMWLHEWAKSNRGNARAIVKRAQHTGVTTLYVRGWSRKGGWEAPRVLRQLLPATRGTQVRVVVWEFAYLKSPVAEARRLAAAARIRVPGSPRVLAVAPDIETSAEGTTMTASRVSLYMRTLRHFLPKDVAILATVPWPSEVRRGHFPYAATARYADAIMPMAYWYNRSPSTVTKFSIRWMERFRRPVLPVGQGYDGRLDAPWLPRVNLPSQVSAFLVAAKHNHVRAVSLWSWQTAPSSVWRRLSLARHFYRAR